MLCCGQRPRESLARPSWLFRLYPLTLASPLLGENRPEERSEYDTKEMVVTSTVIRCFL